MAKVAAAASFFASIVDPPDSRPTDHGTALKSTVRVGTRRGFVESAGIDPLHAAHPAGIGRDELHQRLQHRS
jgi:hypothetical protein